MSRAVRGLLALDRLDEALVRAALRLEQLGDVERAAGAPAKLLGERDVGYHANPSRSTKRSVRAVPEREERGARERTGR